MFTNPNIQSTINQFNGNSFNDLMGFGVYSSVNTTYYYVMDYGANKVYILNDEWKFFSFKTFINPASMIMITIGSNIYLTGWGNIWKVDKDLNILINHKTTVATPGYRGISFNPSNGLIYVEAW